MRRITRATFIVIRRILQILDILFHLIISEPIAVFASFCIFKLAVVVVGWAALSWCRGRAVKLSQSSSSSLLRLLTAQLPGGRRPVNT